MNSVTSMTIELVVFSFLAFGLSLLALYFRKRTENLANKDDVFELQKRIEDHRHENEVSLRELASRLDSDMDIVLRRREVYNELIQSLRFTLGGIDPSQTIEYKKKFMESYHKIWLWAPDELILNINSLVKSLMASEIDIATLPQSQLVTRDCFEKSVLSMRRECGHSETKLKQADFMYIT